MKIHDGSWSWSWVSFDGSAAGGYPEWFREWQRQWAASQAAPFPLTVSQRQLLDDPAPEFDRGDAAFLKALGIDPEEEEA